VKYSYHSLISFLPLLLSHLRLPTPEIDPILILVKVALRLTVSQSVSLGVEPQMGSWPDIYYCYSYDFIFVGRPPWRDDGSVFCICCWPLPAQSFSGLTPLVLAIIFYCLRFETSLFVAFYDSQGHGGGIRPRLHTGSLILAAWDPRYIASRRPNRKHRSLYCCEGVFTAPLHSNGSYSIVSWVFVAAGMCLLSRCLATGLHITIQCI
jgi:hypothetical protein